MIFVITESGEGFGLGATSQLETRYAFKANNINDFNDLYRHFKLRPSCNDLSVQLRFEGMGAVELHCLVVGDVVRDILLKDILDFRQVDYMNDGLKVHVCTPEGTPATILTKAADSFERPICYVLVGEQQEKDQDDV